MRNKQEIIIDDFEPVILRAFVSIFQTKTAYGFVDVEFWFNDNRMFATRGWRIIDSPVGKSKFKLDAPAFRVGIKWHKSVFCEPYIYQKLTEKIIPIFEASSEIVSLKAIDEFNQKETTI